MPGNYRYEEERNRGPRGMTQRGGFGGRGRDDDDMDQYEGERYGGSYGREVGDRGRISERYQGGSESFRGQDGGRDYGRSLGARANEGYDDDFNGRQSGNDPESSRYGAGYGGQFEQGERGQGRWGSQRGGRGGGNEGSGARQGFGQNRGQQSWESQRGGSMQGDGWNGEPEEMRWGRQQGLYGSSEYGGYISSQRSQQDYQSHVGKGPKGWKRSDERVREEVSEALARHPEIDASEIEVRVQNGDITLTGTVADRRAKRLAEDIAEGVFGVNDVQNQIKVQSSKGGDRDVTGTAEREGRSGTEARESHESRKTSATAR